ncbi:MAG: multiple sugar transport system permease protein [Thermotogota bacterium]|nr:multiple sugar transport system permease protein [Thermotogota bacterium]
MVRTKFQWIVVFIGPALILLMVFLIIPIFASLYLSFTDFNVFAMTDWSRARFVGFRNFVELFKDDLFWKALFNTFYCLIVAMPATVVLSLLAAVLLNREHTLFKKFFKVSFFLPFVTNTVAIAVVWSWLLNPTYGLLNWFLSLFGIKGPNWLGDPRWAMPSIIMLVVWKAVGYNTILFLAGLQNIPDFLYEAAELDGATSWQRFWYITLPMLRPTTVFVTTMMIIGYLQLFEEPYMLTQGGPLNSTLSIVLYLYRQGFRFFKLGYASSIAVILFLMIASLTLLRLKLAGRD